MKIIRSIERSELENILKGISDYAEFIVLAIRKTRFYYEVELSCADYWALVINSAPYEYQRSPKTYRTLSYAVSRLNIFPGFLNDDSGGPHGRGLKGTRLREMIQTAETIQLNKCVIMDASVYLGEARTGEYYVIDGMHRLVALGIQFNESGSYEPVTVLCLTQGSLD